MEKSKRAGQFTLAPGEEIYGELTFVGKDTSLYLRDKDEFNTHAAPNQYINGVLHDLTKISLIKCVTPLVPGYAIRGDEKYYFTSIFPHFVVSGDSHIAPDEKVITKVHFTVDDATTLFYDFDAFGVLLDARPFIKEIVAANATVARREIHIGDEPRILYFTGKREIFSADTLIGRVSASHNPVPTTFGGPSGVGLENTIFVTIAFKEPVVFEESILHTSTLLRYFATLIGRPQNIVGLNLEVESSQQNKTESLGVYWSMSPRRESRNEMKGKPAPSDVLLDPVRKAEEFSRVLTKWLDREQTWRDARWRFSNSFANQNNYTIDRLIGAANMFDILPKSALGSDAPQSTKLARKMGRKGKNKLMRKIRYRVEKIINEVGGQFSELPIVTDEAVNCRDYYVHGGKPRFDYSVNFDTVTFFTDALEFVFAASDLIEAGWDVKTWSKTDTVMSHPFARFRIGYRHRLRELKALLPRADS